MIKRKKRFLIGWMAFVILFCAPSAYAEEFVFIEEILEYSNQSEELIITPEEELILEVQESDEFLVEEQKLVQKELISDELSTESSDSTERITTLPEDIYISDEGEFIIDSIEIIETQDYGAEEALVKYMEENQKQTERSMILAPSGKASDSMQALYSRFSRSVYNKNFRNQLSDASKIIYDVMKQQYVDKRDPSEYQCAFDEGDGPLFTITLEDYESKNYKDDYYIVQAAQDALFFDHPEIFWIRSLDTRWRTHEINRTDDTITLEFEYFKFKTYEQNYPGAIDDIAEFDSETIKAVVEIQEQYNICSHSLESEKVKAISRYICDKAVYAYNFEELRKMGWYHIQTAASIFVPRLGYSAVCEGYSHAFKVLCDKFGVNCVIVCGMTTEGLHAWNYVKVEDNSWYLVDVTWNDGGGGYLLSSVEATRIQNTVLSSSVYSQSFVLPVCNTSSFHVHSFDNYVDDNNATCTSNATKTSSCSLELCTATSTIEIPDTMLDHSYEYVSNEDATCISDGTKTNICQECGHVADTVTETGSMSPELHKYEYVSNEDATCGKDGTKTGTCIHCGNTVTETDEGTKTGNHDYTYTSGKAATCKEDGTLIGTCDCGDTIEIIDEGTKTNIHDFVWVYNNNATCGKDGTETGTCSVCRIERTKTAAGTATGNHTPIAVTQEEADELLGGTDEAGEPMNPCATSVEKCSVCGLYIFQYSHDMDYISNNDATCTSYGTKTAYCISCGMSGETVSDPAAGLAGHNYNFISNNDASCKEDGTKTEKCSACGTIGKTITDEGSKTNDHSFTYVSDNNATCKEDGTKTERCVVCGITGATITDEGSKTNNHSFVYMSDNNATCKEDGTKTETCTVCGATGSSVTDEGSKTSNHSFVYTSDNNATCQNDGTKTGTCTICGITETIADIGSKTENHSFVYVSDNNATCKEDGTKTERCTVCDATGNTITDEGTKTDNHSFVYVPNNDATCKENGTKTEKCTVCNATGNTIIDEGSKTDDHSFVYTSDNNATCKEDGTKTGTCSICGTTETITDTGTKTNTHSFEFVSQNDATCKKDGTKTGTCAVCDKTIKVTDAGSSASAAHKYSFVSNKNASCTKDGTKTQICSICGKKGNTVTEIGTMKAHSFGSYVFNKNATVFKDGTKTATCTGCGKKQTVSASGTKLTPTLSLNVSSITLKKGQSTTAVTVSGLASGDSVKSWMSGNTKYVKVDAKTGKITGVKAYSKSIPVTVTLASGKTANISVKVQSKEVKTTKLTNIPSKLTLAKKETYKIEPIRTPITSVQKFNYSSSKKKVATVSSGGVITAKSAGTTNITVKCGNIKKMITVTVPKIKTTKISLSKTSVTLKKKASFTLKASVFPASSDDKITFSSSNKKIATVTSKGKVTTKKAGTAYITVKSGNISQKCKVTVR